MRPFTDAMTDARRVDRPLDVAYVLDPRFPGGTSSAVGAELEVVSQMARVRVHAIETAMFTNRRVAPQLSDTLGRLNLPMEWNSQEIAADIVVFHNPSCLKFQERLNTRIIARHMIVVTHENFLRPGGALAFDVEKCLSQLTSCSIALRRSLAPISAWNRDTTEAWLREANGPLRWDLLSEDWFNICAFEKTTPTTTPKDRRGRLSRPGQEKFPGRDVLEICFPQTADSNVILGADNLMRSDDVPKHWRLYRFGQMAIDHFFDEIDFFVYFTAPTWRESFGRVIAEAIAAGKIVITDPETARPFSGGAIGTNPEDVTHIISEYVSSPERYRADVLSAQDKLGRYSPETFRAHFHRVLEISSGRTT